MNIFKIMLFLFLALSTTSASEADCNTIDNINVSLGKAIHICQKDINSSSEDEEKFYKLGKLYHKKKEYKTAIKWLSKSYRLGYPKAANMLANMIFLGQGTKKDVQLAT